VRPGYEELYKLRHDEIWPEILAELRAAGIRNYNILRYGLTLFGYFETDDLEQSKLKLSTSAINAKWSKFMKADHENRSRPEDGFSLSSAASVPHG